MNEIIKRTATALLRMYFPGGPGRCTNVRADDALSRMAMQGLLVIEVDYCPHYDQHWPGGLEANRGLCLKWGGE